MIAYKLMRVEIPDGADKHERPKSQGGIWYLSNTMKVLRRLTEYERQAILLKANEPIDL